MPAATEFANKPSNVPGTLCNAQRCNLKCAGRCIVHLSFFFHNSRGGVVAVLLFFEQKLHSGQVNKADKNQTPRFRQPLAVESLIFDAWNACFT